MKLLLLTPLIVFICLTALFKTGKAANHPLQQKSMILEAEEINPFNPFLLFI